MDRQRLVVKRASLVEAAAERVQVGEVAEHQALETTIADFAQQREGALVVRLRTGRVALLVVVSARSAVAALRQGLPISR
jgi:hypothetical protein